MSKYFYDMNIHFFPTFLLISEKYLHQNKILLFPDIYIYI